MYRVAYDDGWETDNYFFSSKRNSERKMKKICDGLCISPISLNTQFPLENGHWLLWEKIITEEQWAKILKKDLYSKENKNVSKLV